MIRMVLFAIGFVAITIGLVVFQPGSKRTPMDQAISEPVTRADPAITSTDPVSAPELTRIPNAIVLEPRAPSADPASRTVAAAPVGDMDDQSLRKMTWDTLSNLNHATGQEKAPGQPGSLLHTIVRRSLSEGQTASSDQFGLGAVSGATPEVYVVQQGDSLVSIAERIYGDVNMTGPLFAANQSILARPDDLRPGQTLVLPAQ